MGAGVDLVCYRANSLQRFAAQRVRISVVGDVPTQIAQARNVANSEGLVLELFAAERSENRADRLAEAEGIHAFLRIERA